MVCQNRDTMKFALMWANQDWVDVHPAKRGWNGCYRGHKGDPTNNSAKLPQLQMFGEHGPPARVTLTSSRCELRC